MYINSETIDFLQFIGIGVILAVVFDIFRSYRIYKKVNRKKALFQDILYFIIAWIIIIFALLNLLDGDIRLYLFVGLLIGVVIYFSTFSNLFLKLNIKLFKFIAKLFEYICLPIKFNYQVLQKICIFLFKIIKKCCKMFLNVVFSIYSFIKSIFLKLFKSKKQKNKKQKSKKLKCKNTKNKRLNFKLFKKQKKV